MLWRSQEQVRLFQSHLGSITTSAEAAKKAAARFVSIPSWFDYNLQRRARCSLQLRVSIPSWFDYNCRAFCVARAACPSFQSHLGSITTARLRHGGGRCSSVSIPSWFDYNSTSRKISCSSSTVSIPSWFDYNRWQVEWVLLLAHVSIPSWFDYNMIRNGGVIYSTDGFNPILVRLQPRPRRGPTARNVPVSIPSWFDYNWRLYYDPKAVSRVSIPSWFDYNLRLPP